ncbi:MAG: hypothetical protein NTU49_04235, partial [Gammaproteobacteria bacterium]|nr:hypothetical protein [Gammaproteobacteria bacterium]
MNVIKMLPLFFLTCAAQASITDQLKPESFFDTFFHDLSFHHDVKTVNGDTLKYQPQPDDYNFSTPITSSLLMVDITPS